MQNDHANARAVLGRFVAELLAEPDELWRARMRDEQVFQEARTAAVILGVDERLLAAARTAAVPQHVRDRRGAILGHTARSECPPYELEYARRDVFQQAHALADIAAFYRAFGLEVHERGERHDHFTAQWEFLSLCAWKEANVDELLDADPPEISRAREACRDAQRAFLKDHAARWMPAFFARLRKADADGFYGRAADLAEALLSAWCEEFGVCLGPDWLELRPEDEEDLQMECGPGTGPGQVALGPTLAAAMGGGA